MQRWENVNSVVRLHGAVVVLIAHIKSMSTSRMKSDVFTVARVRMVQGAHTVQMGNTPTGRGRENVASVVQGRQDQAVRIVPTKNMKDSRCEHGMKVLDITDAQRQD